METPAQDREIISDTMRNRNILGAFILYALFIPVPLLLFGRFQGAFLAVLLFGIFAFFNQAFFTPPEKYLDAMMRVDDIDPMREDNPYGQVDY